MRFACFEYGLYMFCVAYMIYAHECCCKMCDGSLLHLVEQEHARTHKDVCVCVFNEVSFSNMDCISVV